MSPPLLSTRDCADVLGVDADFIRGEIHDERLRAVITIKRDGKRTVYRVSVEDFRAYCRRYAPAAVTRIVA